MSVQDEAVRRYTAASKKLQKINDNLHDCNEEQSRLSNELAIAKSRIQRVIEEMNIQQREQRYCLDVLKALGLTDKEIEHLKWKN